MKKNISNMMNIVSANRIKVLCLAALALLMGTNNEVYGGDGVVLNAGKSAVYQLTGTGIEWNDPANWTTTNATASPYFPGQLLFDNGQWGVFGCGVVEIKKTVIFRNISEYVYDNRHKQAASFNTIFDIQCLKLLAGADLTIDDTLFLTGSGVNPSYQYTSGNLKINEGGTLIAGKGFQLNNN